MHRLAYSVIIIRLFVVCVCVCEIILEQIILEAAKAPIVTRSTSGSCAARRAFCNRLVGLLYQSAHYSTFNYKMVPLQLSHTDCRPGIGLGPRSAIISA